MLTPEPYKPYRPPGQTSMNAAAADKSNIAQGKMGDQITQMASANVANTLGQYGTTGTYTGGAYVPPQYPIPQIQNPPYYQAPTPPNAINEANALANTSPENQQYAKDVINAYKQHLGRVPDEAGYAAYLNRAVSEKADWNTITQWLRNSEEGQRYQTMRDVGLQIDPEQQAMEREYARWVQENQGQVGFLQENLREGRERYTTDFQTAMEDLARSIIAQKGSAENLANRSGIWTSGILGKRMGDIDLSEALTRARTGSEFGRNLGNLERTYGLNVGQIENRASLYGQQYNDQVNQLMQRREGLTSQALDKLLATRQEQEWQQKLFDWEQQKFFMEMAARGGGGGGYGGGGGGGTAATSQDAMSALWRQAQIIRQQGGSDQDVINIMDQAFSGGREGYNTMGVSPEDYGAWREMIGANPAALTNYPRFNAQDEAGINEAMTAILLTGGSAPTNTGGSTWYTRLREQQANQPNLWQKLAAARGRRF